MRISCKPDIIKPFMPLFDPYRYKVYFGGRAGSKSWGYATALILLAVQKPLRVLCAREIQISINDSVKRILDDTIKRLGLISVFHSTKTEIRCTVNDSLFFFAGLRDNIASLKSKEGIDICWIEEAETVSQDSIDIIIPTIRKADSEIWFSFNPRSEASPVYQKFVINDPPEDSFIRKINYDENPYFPAVLRKEMEWDKTRDLDKYNHVWLGNILKQSEAVIFKNWKIEDFEAPEGTIFYYGADWGFSNDPTVLLRCFIKDKILFIDHEAWGVGVELDETAPLFRSVPESHIHKIRADNARPETISYMKRQGFNIVAAKKGPGSIQDGITLIKNYDIVVHSRCKHTIDDFTLYSWKQDKRTNEILSIPVDANNDCIDSLRYALEAITKARVYI